MTSTYIGKPITRKEDVRFITGRGKYTDDFKFQHLLHAAILRSPHPHARILSIDASKAREIPGVEAVFTSHDIAGSIGLRHITFRMAPLPGLERFLQYPIAHDKVRYVGEPVAVVVASSRYVAEDACDAIDVRYEPLPAVHDVASSAADNSFCMKTTAPTKPPTTPAFTETRTRHSKMLNTPVKRPSAATVTPPTLWRPVG